MKGFTMHRVRDTFLGLMLIAASFLAIVPSAHAQLTPELTVEDLQVSEEDTPDLGNDIHFNATVRNSGDGSASDIEVNFTIGSRNLGTVLIQSLDAGEQTTVQSPDTWEVEAGNYTLTVTAEGTGPLGTAVSDEASKSFAFGADLEAVSLEWSPEDPVAGDDVVFTATVKNTVTDVNVDESFDVAVYLDGAPEVTATVNGLLGGQQKTVQLPAWEASAGSYQVELVVDDGDDVDEREPDNNRLDPETLDVAPAIPDLVIGHLVATENPSEIVVEARVLNQGNGTAPASSVRILYDDVQQEDLDIGELDPGASEDVVLSIEKETGRHTIEAIADVNGTVSEANEANNDAETEIVIGSDIVATNLTLDPDEPQTGDMVRFQVNLTNEGSAISESFRVAFRVDGSLIGNATVDGLGADETLTVQSPAWNATEGAHTARVHADADDDIAEADDANNEIETSFTVSPPQADLVVTRIQLDPDRPESGEDARFEATVKNRGNADAGSFDVRFALDGSTLGSDKTVDGLAAGESTTVRSDVWNAQRGDHAIEVTADVAQPALGDQVDEANEANNDRTLRFGIGPDLLPVDVTFESATATPGSNVTFTTLVRNDGTEAAGSFDVRVELDGELLGTETIDGLDANESATVTHNWTAVEGNHALQVTVDPDEDVDEIGPDNNVRNETFSIGPDQPDLVVTSISVPDDPETGDGLAFLATVKNQGNATAGGMTVTLTIDGSKPLGTKTVEPLEPGASASVSSDQWTATEGEHEITVTVDADGQVSEANEANNVLNETFEVEAPSEDDDDDDDGGGDGPPPSDPDLSVSAVTWTDDPEPGDRLTFLATIRNGGGEATSSFEVSFLLDGDTPLGNATIQALGPGSSASLTSSSWTAVEGNHTITVAVDVQNTVDEANEENNLRSETFNVTAREEDDEDDDPPEGEPDLTVTALTVDQDGLEEDDTVTFTATIENTGDAMARNFTVRFEVGGEVVGEPVRVDELEAGTSHQVTSASWTAVEGDHTVTATIDAPDEVDEANEANNEQAQGFTVESGNFLPAPGLLLLASVLAAMAALVGRRR